MHKIQSTIGNHANTGNGTPSGKYDRRAETARIAAEWVENPRWQGIARTYSAEDVVRLRGSIKRDNTVAALGAERLWNLLVDAVHNPVHALAALSGGQAVAQVEAGASAIYLSGRQAVADHANAESIRPDHSLYAVNSVPSLVRRVNNAFERADQIQWQTATAQDDTAHTDYFAPIVADAEAHTDGALNAYELTQNMIRAGAAGVVFDDQLTSTKQRSRTGDVLMPTSDVVQKLSAARLAADVEGVPTLIVARTTANTTGLLSADSDPHDQPFIEGERTEAGFYRVRAGIEHAVARGLAYAPHADVLWLETTQPDLEQAREFAAAIRRAHAGRRLAYSCAATAHREPVEIERLQHDLAALGYEFLFFAPASSNDAMDTAREDLAA